MTSHSSEICFHLWKLALVLPATLVQCADIQCEIQTSLLKITLKLLNLQSLGIIEHILEVSVLYSYCRNTRGEMHLCIAVGIADNFEIFGGIDANRKTIRTCSAVVAFYVNDTDCAQAPCCSCSRCFCFSQLQRSLFCLYTNLSCIDGG